MSRYFVYLAYAGTAIVALAQVIAALGQTVDFLRRVLGDLGMARWWEWWQGWTSRRAPR